MNAEFGRLLHDDVHSVAPGYALYQPYSERRLGIPGIMFTDAQIQFVFRHCADGCGVLAAAAVKYRQCIARPQAQHATGIACLFTAKRQLCICAQLNRAKET